MSDDHRHELVEAAASEAQRIDQSLPLLELIIERTRGMISAGVMPNIGVKGLGQLIALHDAASAHRENLLGRVDFWNDMGASK
jgi:hypothetical protein